MKPRIVALVPMRHWSERIPGKNYRPFLGKPLYHYILNSLLSCHLIDEIAIDTDSPLISENLSQHFPQVRLIERPSNLAGDTVPMNDVLSYDVNQVKADYYLQTHSTNPLLRSETITRAIETFLSPGGHDSLFGVTKMQTRLYDARSWPINHDPAILLRTQDLPPIYEENSTLYIFSKKTLDVRKNRIGSRPIMFEVNREEAIDIDEEFDFLVAEFFYQQRRERETKENEMYSIDNSFLSIGYP